MKIKPHIKLIKIKIDLSTGDIEILENLNDPEKLFKLFATLAQRYQPTAKPLDAPKSKLLLPN